MPQGSICAIIPTFNRQALLRECIDSILDVGARVSQIVVVNDGSTDGTRDLVRSYGDRATLVDKPNGGKSSALNVGLEQCAADYVWICDDDDIAARGGIEHLAGALDADAGVGFAFGRFETFRDTPDGRVFAPPSFWMRPDEPNIHLQFLEEMFTFQYAILARRDVYAQVGPFREDLVRSQDHEMMIRISRRYASTYVPQVMFFQRAHDGMRGSAWAGFSATQSAAKWLEAGQRIISEIRVEYGLDEFTPTFAREWPERLARRAALVERATICASRALWPEALADLRDAAMFDASTASPQERFVAEAVIRNPLAWRELARNEACKKGLRDLWRSNPFGASIVEACCRPLVWQSRASLRGGDLAQAVRSLAVLLDLLPVAGAVRRLSASALS